MSQTTRGMGKCVELTCTLGAAATAPVFSSKDSADAVKLSFEAVGLGVTNGFIQFSNNIDENNPDITAAALAATWKNLWRDPGLLQVSTPPSQNVVYEHLPFPVKAWRVASGDDFAPTTFPSTFSIRVWKQFEL